MLAGLAEMRQRKLAKPALCHSPPRLIGISHCIVSVTRVWVTVMVLVAGLLVSVTVIATEREPPQVALAFIRLNLYMSTYGRSMSLSSCSRIWQCHMYLRMRSVGKASKRTMIRVTCFGFARTVSFQPISLGSGGM